MPADLVARMGLDDREFRKGLDSLVAQIDGANQQMEKGFSRTSRAVERMMRFQVIGRMVRGAWREAADAVNLYAEQNDFARAALERMQGPLEQLKVSIGRDVFHALSALEGPISSVVGWIERGRTAIVDWLAAPWADEGIDAARRAMEEQDAAIRRDNAFRGLSNQAFAGLASATGDKAGAALARETEQHENNRRAIAEAIKTYKLLPDQVEALRETERQRHEAAVRAIIDEDNARLVAAEQQRQRGIDEEARKARDADQKRTDALDELDRAVRMMEIDELRARGEKERADEARRRLELEQRIADVMENEALTEAEKLEAARRLRVAAASLEAAELAGAKPVAQDPIIRTFTLAAGLGGGGLERQVLGTGGTINRAQELARQQLAEQRKTNQTLAKIAENTESRVALYGP